MRFAFALILCLFAVKQQFAQDTIVKRDRRVVIAKIIEISETEVRYKRFDLPDGPLYIESKADIEYIAYPNGDKDKFAAAPQPAAIPAPSHPFLISANHISYLKNNTWEQKGIPMNEEQLHSILLKSGDPELKRRIRSASIAKKNQYVGFVAIPAGITGIVLGAIATTRIFDTNRYGNTYDPGDYIFGSMFCAVIAVSTNIYGASAFHAHRRKNAQAVELYNQLY